MKDPLELRSLARRCRMLTQTWLKPSVNKQLWLWAAELTDHADEIEEAASGARSRPAGRRRASGGRRPFHRQPVR